MKAQVYMLRQDDPFKCTAARLVKFHLADSVRSIPKKTILLNPFAQQFLLKKDRIISNSVCVIDCSWEQVDRVLKKRRVSNHGMARRLPLLLAANPTNYSKPGKLSSAEAIAACLFILGFRQVSQDIINKFKWGHTFLELNSDPLEDYTNANSQEQIRELEKQYFPQLS